MPNIFISYSRKDSHIIDRLAARLERDCYEVFVDRDDITPGASWSQRIVDAINQADMFVVVLSSNSAKSDNVAKEIDLALTSQRRILPIALAPANRIALSESLEYELASRQMLDFYTGGFDRAYARLWTELRPLTKEEQKKCRRPLIIGRGWIAAGSLALAGVAIIAVMFLRGVAWEVAGTPSFQHSQTGVVSQRQPRLRRATSQSLSQCQHSQQSK